VGVLRPGVKVEPLLNIEDAALFGFVEVGGHFPLSFINNIILNNKKLT
jgi:hypothetical protein